MIFHFNSIRSLLKVKFRYNGKKRKDVKFDEIRVKSFPSFVATLSNPWLKGISSKFTESYEISLEPVNGSIPRNLQKNLYTFIRPAVVYLVDSCIPDSRTGAFKSQRSSFQCIKNPQVLSVPSSLTKNYTFFSLNLFIHFFSSNWYFIRGNKNEGEKNSRLGSSWVHRMVFSSSCARQRETIDHATRQPDEQEKCSKKIALGYKKEKEKRLTFRTV